jgi:hypothetical protein
MGVHLYDLRNDEIRIVTDHPSNNVYACGYAGAFRYMNNPVVCTSVDAMFAAAASKDRVYAFSVMTTADLPLIASHLVKDLRRGARPLLVIKKSEIDSPGAHGWRLIMRRNSIQFDEAHL